MLIILMLAELLLYVRNASGLSFSGKELMASAQHQVDKNFDFSEDGIRDLLKGDFSKHGLIHQAQVGHITTI